MKIDWEKFKGRTTFVVGPDKNVGKTTFLNLALSHLRTSGCRPAYLSVGVDGEAFDQISGAVKPAIVAEPGDFLVTAETALDHSDVSVSVLKTFPEKTVLGQLILGEVEQGGRLELIGPETNRQLSSILESIAADTAANATLVDGAVNRVTQVSATENACFVYTVIVRRANVGRIAEELERLSLVDRLPAASGDGGAEGVVVDGALTRGKLKEFHGGGGPVLVEDFTKLFLTGKELAKLCRERRLSFRRRYELLFVMVHCEDVERNELLKEVAGDDIVDRLIFTSDLA